MARLCAGAALCLAAASAANAANAARLDPDLLTTSGRAGLPSAAGTPLAGALRLGALSIAPDLQATTGFKSEELSAALRTGVEKSLANYGYHAAPSSGPAPRTLDLEVRPLEMTADEAGMTVVAHLVFTSSDAQGPGSACFPFEAVGRFHALKPLHAGGHQRTIAFLAVVAIAATGYNAAPLFNDQLASANARDAALNSRRKVGVGEDVAPGGGERDLERFGAINALQVAGGALIAHLGEPGGCNAHSGTTTAAGAAASASVERAALRPASDATPDVRADRAP